MTATPLALGKGFKRRIASQGALLLMAFGFGQALSLGRNALLGHWLSKGDFGIAATITLALQLVEMLSDPGVDRLIVQSSDGDDERLIGSAHSVLLVRGLLTALALLVLAGPIAAFFHVAEAAPAFQIAALVPLLRGLNHLDARRFQRRYDNRAYSIVEIVPQAIALALMLPALRMMGGYQAVVAVLIVQALLALLLSHAVAERRYHLRLDTTILRRLLAFGWPIWLSAIPLVAVFQGERIIVGRVLGVEALAAFTVAFMVTMVPGLAAAKVGQALMLPLLSQVRGTKIGDARRFRRRLKLLAEAITLAAALYATLFVIAGNELLPIAFGPAYGGLGALATSLAMMWMLRIVQVVPGMALMALGVTAPLLVAGCVRAVALPGALMMALAGASLPAVTAVGVAAEMASLIYVCSALGTAATGSTLILLRRYLFLIPACAAAFLTNALLPSDGHVVLALATAAGLGSALAMAAFAVMPGLRRFADLPRFKPART